MKVSVIVPSYNCARWLPKCLDSVKAQTYTDWECIVVNDGSTDDTQRIVDDYVIKDARFLSVRLMENGGLPAARNAGVEYSTGDALFFLDADDWLDSYCIEYLVEQSREHPDVGRLMVSCLSHWWTDNPAIARATKWKLEPSGVHEPDSPHLFSGDSCDVGHCTGCLYIRELIDPKALVFPAKVFRFEDMIFNMGLIFAGVKTHLSDLCLYHYLRRVGSITLTFGYTEQNAMDARVALAMCAYNYPPQREVYERCKGFLENRLEQALRIGGANL